MANRDMSPFLSTSDRANVFGIDVEFISQHLTVFRALKNYSNRFFIKARIGSVLSSSLTVLLDFVGHVFGLSSEEQMGRIHARRIVATMKNTESFRNRSVGESPAKSMDSNRLLGLGVHYLSIPMLGSTSGPDPAFLPASFFDLYPEAFRDRLSFSHEHLHACDRGRSGLNPAPVPFILAEAA